ncbi:MAG TPA: M24 family metallopeptidase [Acidimicrobiia bacterium]
MAEGLARALDQMERRDLDVLVLGRESNARFVSDATRLWLAGTRPFAPGCVVVRGTGAVHLMSVTDFGVPPDIPGAQLYPMSWNPANILGTVAAIPGVSGARRIGVDGLTPLFEQLLAATLPNAEVVDGEAAMRAARRVKSPAQIDRIRDAISVAEDALGAAVDALQPGVSERELKGVFEERMCQLGATTPAFEGTFCVVEDDRPIRRLVSERKVVDGDLVAMSAGVLVDGWEGSLARTWPCGAATAEHRRRWSIWRDQWTNLFGSCQATTRVGGLRDIAPRASVHGIGLGYEALEDDAVLEVGMVVELELEAAGVLGADALLIGDADNDHELLTTFPHRDRSM